MSGTSDDYKKFIAEKDPTIDASLDQEEVEAAAMIQAEEDKRAAERDMEISLFDGIRSGSDGPVQPIRLKGTDRFCFSCHKGVSCWNECCHNTDITLTPHDILRLSSHLNLRPAEFLAQFTLPAEFGQASLPVAKLRVADEKDGRLPCVFLHDEEGCQVYEARPASCRYYPLGLATVKMKGHEAVDDFHFLVREPHCKGHDEAKEQSVEEFLSGQGVADDEAKNRGWLDILMKMASWKVVGGPFGREPDKRTRKMFFMATTDVDAFRRFVFETRFLDTYEIEAETVEILRENDEALLELGFDWLKNVLFNEPTIAMKEHVLKSAIAKARSDLNNE